MGKLFGTDGVRGVANVYPMNVEMAIKLGRAASHIFKKARSGRHKVIIGKDTRLSGYMLESALMSGICSMGVDVLLVGPLPTPAIAFMTKNLRADAGVVISASHNPYQDNGIKFFSPDGYKLPDEIEEEMESLIFSNDIDSIRPTAEEVGKAFRIDDAEGRYVSYIKTSFPKEYDLSGIKIVIDCANGAAYKAAPLVMQELGADIVVLNNRPDGCNINKDCGSLHPDVIIKAVLDHGADIGISLDGDADRVIFSDEKGSEVNGDPVMVFSALDMKSRGVLRENTLVTTVMSNMGLELALKKQGIRVVRTQVGDRYVAEEMIRGGYNLGGEQSGHILFMDYNTTGDGILSALQVLSIMRRSGKSLSELASVMTTLPQILKNVRVREKKDFESLPDVKKAIHSAEQKLKEEGRVLVRYSGTENKARVMIEGPDSDSIRDMAESIAGEIEKAIGVKN
ncbi:MAG: phosphoglucosamine mutase [Nitrospirae bacterium CG_4_9_14_3_um_filter_53_35]|nr:MAG: phosphoglucosamine mutase [Nitrospirae bacterium CG2_30_53_67]PIS36317.1 MAG: phosphoglucosamine mutase [Nitrospirae bacterium CG08_land_8_20_14_0_20_52_24]PIV84900.1 MAG: phosphoglucosamine mutase [Nitrospirae bacterium CG17_big_fil_post_rev_8_21_14_2_50_50_9]PIX86484.1 MAG: phosphoglucosamine mutase [Nitrospirae bacterium CG_4_10_14_3_um_filter_53_41]PJA73010.1 MAG: phosphoglucosamine mutase [Nitrospirae bacterium CG_4_9_14_3_um_filter_53_35]